MNKSAIVCNCSLFSLNQNIFLIDKEGNQTHIATSDMNGLGNTLSYLSNQFDIDTIILSGCGDYQTKILKDLYGDTKFAKDKITVEVK